MKRALGCLCLVAGGWIAACGGAGSSEWALLREGLILPDQEAAAACTGVDCAGHGTCFAGEGRPSCLCDAGYVAEGLGLVCVPAFTQGPTEAAFASIVEIAVAEKGRGPTEVGKDLTVYPYDLGRYLGSGEAWCSEFVAWVYKVAGQPFTGGSEGGWMIGDNTAIRSWFQREKKWMGRADPGFAAFTPMAGDFMRLNNSGGGHSTIVREVQGATLLTVEGNSGNLVRLGTYNNYKSNTAIDGFGMRLSRDNQPPTVDAGPDQTVVLPQTARLLGMVKDDGRPGSPPQITWSRVDGPADVSIQQPQAAEIEAIFSVAGTYTLRLTADDGEKRSSDDAVITVEAAPPENPQPGPPAENTGTGSTASPVIPAPSSDPVDGSQQATRVDPAGMESAIGYGGSCQSVPGLPSILGLGLLALWWLRRRAA